jgi:hypothetical protein
LLLRFARQQIKECQNISRLDGDESDFQAEAE